MTLHWLSRWVGAATVCAAACASAQAATFKATLIAWADDPRLERSRLDMNVLSQPGGPAAEGLRLGLEDAEFELAAVQAKWQLDVVQVANAAEAKAAAAKADKAGATVLLTDLDAAGTVAVADGSKLPVLNLGEAADRLRQADCRANLFHLLPSERMRADALAQTLVARKWQQVLLLTGPSAADAERSALAQAALKRYGLKVVATKAFKLSADPRERDLANPLLLTGNLNYDAVWVVDSDGEFARGLPYRTALPRPVVGDGGLFALAWGMGFERFGAPQLAKRFAKAAQRPMRAQDWAAWLAGKALATAAVAAPKGPAAAVASALARGAVDGYKGTALSFRAWDGQLRQPLMLTDGQGVVSMAPVDGVMHPQHALDTLGADAPEGLCKARK